MVPDPFRAAGKRKIPCGCLPSSGLQEAEEGRDSIVVSMAIIAVQRQSDCPFTSKQSSEMPGMCGRLSCVPALPPQRNSCVSNRCSCHSGLYWCLCFGFVVFYYGIFCRCCSDCGIPRRKCLGRGAFPGAVSRKVGKKRIPAYQAKRKTHRVCPREAQFIRQSSAAWLGPQS